MSPLTDAEIEQGRHETFSTSNPFCPCDSKTFLKAARWTERRLASEAENELLRLRVSNAALADATETLVLMLMEWHADFPESIGDKEEYAIKAARIFIAAATGTTEKQNPYKPGTHMHNRWIRTNT